MKCLEQYLTPEKQLEMEGRYYLSDPHTHERRVLDYSMQLFSKVSQPFGLGRKKRTLLHYSALLHDIGYEISPQKHDTHTFALISRDPFFDFWPEPERLMLALVAGGHRKSIPVEINQLPPKKQDIVRQLTALLRIADAIDYPRDQSLFIRYTEMTNEELVIVVQSTASATVAARVAQKSLLFQQVFGLNVKATGL